jgi:hypothetical protein
MGVVNGRSLTPDYAGSFAQGAQTANTLQQQKLANQQQEQTLAANQAVTDKQNQFDKLSAQYDSGVYGEGESQSGTFGKMQQVSPELAKQWLEGENVYNQKTADEYANFGTEMIQLPVEMQDAFIDQYTSTIDAKGESSVSAAQIKNMTQPQREQYIKGIQMLADKTRSKNMPAAQRQYQNLVAIAQNPLSSETEKNSARVALGLQPRAATSATERIAGSEELTEKVAKSTATIEAAKEGGKEEAKLTKQLQFKPQITKAIKLAEKAANERGDTLSSLQRSKAALPGLTQAVGQLKELAPFATSTIGGKVFDFAVKQSGFGSTTGATARAKFVAIVNNQVLPLLKETFGAAFTAQEGESLKATMGDPDASPEEKMVQLDAFIAQKMRDIETRETQLAVEEPSAADGTIITNKSTGERKQLVNGKWEDL